MTDIAQSAVTADQSSTPTETESTAPASIETERHDALEKTSSTLDSSLDNAFDKVFGNEAKPEGKAYERDETGRFAPKTGDKVENTAATAESTAAPTAEAQPVETKLAIEAPTRFSADAKAAWATTPDPVKAEINRAMSEMERGLQEYQTRYAPLKPYEEMAKQSGSSLETALQNYTNMETMLVQNPVAAFEKICEFIGKTPQQFFSEISSGQQQTVDPVVMQLRQQVEQLQQQLSGVSTTIQSQQESEMQQQIEAWAADKPRFNELRETMAKLAQSGMVNDLDEAYEMASRLKPAAVQSTPIQPKPDLKAQTLKGSLSTTGAPVSGSNPALRKPASSATEAINRAFSAAGL